MLILWIAVLNLGSVLSSLAYGYNSQQISVLITTPMKVFIRDYFHIDFIYLVLSKEENSKATGIDVSDLFSNCQHGCCM